MPQSLARIYVHLIFSTKLREPLIANENRSKLNAYIAGTLNNLECPAIEVNCVADHVHALFILSKNLALAKVVEKIKTSSQSG